jgi:hypothetical protein
MNPLLNSPFDDLQQATEDQLRTQYLEIQRFIDETEAGMTEEQFNSPAKDYMWDNEERRLDAIRAELRHRGLANMNEWLKDREEASEPRPSEPGCPRCGSDNVKDDNRMTEPPADRFSCEDCGFTWEEMSDQEEAEEL